MSTINAKVCIPFRMREGGDLRRAANLEVVMAWWWALGYEPTVVDDGLDGDKQFNRHRAYNRAVSGNPDVDVFVFAEADMLIHPDQILAGIDHAAQAPGLVVPFTQYRYLSDGVTEHVRDVFADPRPEVAAMFIEQDVVFGLEPESTMDNGTSIGAINIVSRDTLNLTGGFTELTEGNWYDDRIIEEGFAYLTGCATRYVEGPAVHLYHLPGHPTGSDDHLTEADKRATARNRNLLIRMRADIRMGNRDGVKRLLAYREGAQR